MIKRLLLFIVVALLLSSTAITQEDDTIRIGALTKNVDNPHFQSMISGYEFSTERYDVEILIGSVPTAADQDQQVQILNDWLVNEEIDVLIVTPFTSDSLVMTLVRASELGIPIINTDELISSDIIEEFDLNIVAQIASNNVRAGNLAAEYALNNLPEGTEVAVVEGLVGAQSSIDRVQGFILDAERDGLRVVSSQPANWDADEAYTVTLSTLEQFPDIQCIFAANDGMALGVIRALEEVGREDVIVLSVDGSPEARESIAADELVGSVAQFPFEMAVLAVEAAIKVAEDRPVAPFIESPVALVTAEDLE